MRVSDETLYEGTPSEMTPTGEDIIQVMVDVVIGVALILSAFFSMLVPSRKRKGRHSA